MTRMTWLTRVTRMTWVTRVPRVTWVTRMTRVTWVTRVTRSMVTSNSSHLSHPCLWHYLSHFWFID